MMFLDIPSGYGTVKSKDLIICRYLSLGTQSPEFEDCNLSPFPSKTLVAKIKFSTLSQLQALSNPLGIPNNLSMLTLPYNPKPSIKADSIQWKTWEVSKTLAFANNLDPVSLDRSKSEENQIISN